MKYVPLIGRILFAAVFIMFGLGHLTQTAMMAFVIKITGTVYSKNCDDPETPRETGNVASTAETRPRGSSAQSSGLKDALFPRKRSRTLI